MRVEQLNTSAHLVHSLGSTAATTFWGAYRDTNHLKTSVRDRNAGDGTDRLALNDELAGQGLEDWEVREPSAMEGPQGHTLGAHQAAVAVTRDSPAACGDQHTIRVMIRRYSVLGIKGAADLTRSAERMQVTEYDSGGFELQGDIYVPSSVALLSHSAFLWRPRRVSDVSNSLVLFTLVHPRPEILILGLNEPARIDSTWLRDQGIAVEQMDTKNAVHTFNVLNDELRHIAAALLTPTPRQDDYSDPFEPLWPSRS